MVLILPIFAQITVWFQYKQKRFLHAFMNMLEMETHPKKKKMLKVLIAAASVQNTVLSLELEPIQKT